MSEQNNEHRCIICDKLLLDEKIPICKRCILEGRNKAPKAVGAVGGFVLSAIGIKKVVDDNSGNNNV